MATVAGIFDNPIEANEAITELLALGVGRNQISLLMSEATRDKFQTASDDENDRLVKDSATGGLAGGAFGAILAGLAAAGTIAIPGLGLLVAGPLVAIAAGAGAGAAAGGIVGAFIAAGINQMDADKYVGAVKAGKAVVLVHDLDDENKNSVRSILTDIASAHKAA